MSLSPWWTVKYPELLAEELDLFSKAGAKCVLDQEWLDKGIVAVDIDWPKFGQYSRLRVIYPDHYPFVRPEVLLTDAKFYSHRNPLSGQLCLLGRGTHNWRPTYRLAQILESQLPKIIKIANNPDDPTSRALEDPQGEPVEFYWNSRGIDKSYILVDSGAKIPENSISGVLKLQISNASLLTDQPIQGYVKEIRIDTGKLVFEWDAPVPPQLTDKSFTVDLPWRRCLDPLIPTLSTNVNELLHLAWRSDKAPILPFRGSKKILKGAGLIYPCEMQHDVFSDGWLFLISLGKARKGHKETLTKVVPTLRAGTIDIGTRVPIVKSLREKTVAVCGLGAIGAPIVIELAKNQVAKVNVLDGDEFSPGTLPRWALGTSYYGWKKVDAIKDHIEREYGATKIKCFDEVIGRVRSPHDAAKKMRCSDVISEFLEDVDLVIDATAEFAIREILNEECSKRGIPLIASEATSTLEGGYVGLFTGEGCPRCLETEFWKTKSIKMPPGKNETQPEGIQPPGCSERTFAGHSYDIKEISLQTVRVATTLLSNVEKLPSQAHVLDLTKGIGGISEPRWKTTLITRQKDCICLPKA